MQTNDQKTAVHAPGGHPSPELSQEINRLATAVEAHATAAPTTAETAREKLQDVRDALDAGDDDSLRARLTAAWEWLDAHVLPDRVVDGVERAAEYLRDAADQVRAQVDRAREQLESTLGKRAP